LNLYRSTGNGKALPDLIKQRMKFNGIEFSLPGKDRNELQGWIGTRARQLLKQYSSAPEFAAVPDDYKVKLISNGLDTIRSAGMAKYFLDQVNKQPPEKREQYQQELFRKHGLTPNQMQQVFKDISIYQQMQ